MEKSQRRAARLLRAAVLACFSGVFGASEVAVRAMMLVAARSGEASKAPGAGGSGSSAGEAEGSRSMVDAEGPVSAGGHPSAQSIAAAVAAALRESRADPLWPTLDGYLADLEARAGARHFAITARMLREMRTACPGPTTAEVFMWRAAALRGHALAPRGGSDRARFAVARPRLDVFHRARLHRFDGERPRRGRAKGARGREKVGLTGRRIPRARPARERKDRPRRRPAGRVPTSDAVRRKRRPVSDLRTARAEGVEPST